MPVKQSYLCKKISNYIRVIATFSDSGIAHVETVNCKHLTLQNCFRYGGACRPLKKAQKDARYHNRDMNSVEQTRVSFTEQDYQDAFDLYKVISKDWGIAPARSAQTSP